MVEQPKRSLGKAIDSIVDALETLDDDSKLIAVKAACAHLNIPLGNEAQTVLPPRTVTPTQSEQIAPSSTQSPDNTQIIDIRSLKESKNPNNAVEMACIVAFYLGNTAPTEERRNEIFTKDIDRYFKQGGFPLPKVPGQVLRDAKAAGYLDSAGRGSFKLNPVGYNLVAHTLPRAKGKKS
jgi:hypothetical protein